MALGKSLATITALALSSLIGFELYTKYAGAGGGPPPPPGTSNVTVTVVDNTTGNPVQFPQVTIGSTTTTGGANGVAVFNGVPFGSYALTAVAAGYVSTTESVSISESSQPFTIRLSPTSGCTPLTCPCGQAWNPVDCKCEADTPASIVVDSESLTEDLSWFVEYRCISNTIFQGKLADSGGNPLLSCPSNLLGCPEATGLNGTFWGISIGGTVYDKDNKPLCGVTVNANLSQSSFLWAVTYMGIEQFPFCNAQATGSINVTAFPTSTVTDENGRFYFDVVFEINANPPDNWTGCIDPVCCSQTLNSEWFNFTDSISFSIAGTRIAPATTVMSIKNIICENEVAS